MSRYPVYYQRTEVTLDRLRELFEPRMHPEFARRLFNWLEAQDGRVGIGGGWRATGSQPDKPGFAPEGRSFHQSQQFPSGEFYTAVDLVVRRTGNTHSSGAMTSADAPQQGSPEAVRWGVHINVGSEGSSGYEPWHMQPVEIDGYSRWEDAGKPDLQVGYPIPGGSMRRRIVDTREPGNGGPFERDEVRRYDLGAGGGVLVAVTLQHQSPTSGGWLRIWGPGPEPDTSDVLGEPDWDLNTTLVRTDDTGRVSVRCSHGGHVIVDFSELAG